MPLYYGIGFNTLRWIVDGTYENGELKIVKNTISKTDRVLEIGTGLGFISSYCAQAIGSSQVITFEANPTNIEISRQVFQKNRVDPVCTNAFLSKEDSVVSFSIKKKSLLASSNKLMGDYTVEIPSMNLNKVIKDFMPTYLIMDIEGGEHEIFSFIDFHTINKIQFELHPSILGSEKCDEIFKSLNANHFEMNVKHSATPNYYFTRSAPY